MLKYIDKIVKYNNLRNDISHYINFLTKKENLTKNNIFDWNIKDKKEWLLNLLNIYDVAKWRWGIYFLTNNIENIFFLYKKILRKKDFFELPEIILNFLKENILSYESNKKINVIKDIDFLKYFLLQIWYITSIKEQEILKYKIVKNNVLLPNLDFSLDKLNELNPSILELFFYRNETTIYNRTEYQKKEAIKRIKRDFQELLINYNYINNIDLKSNDIEYIITHIENITKLFWKNIINYYLSDLIYYLSRNKEILNIEILSEINNFLLELENNLLEDYYIIDDENKSINYYIQNNFISIIKNNIIWEIDENIYIDYRKISEEIKLFFSYRIYF